jgi:putative thiamine transport system substrate-binding protein
LAVYAYSYDFCSTCEYGYYYIHLLPAHAAAHFYVVIFRGLLALCLSVSINAKASTEHSYWQNIEASGKNQEVYFYAWGGDGQINAYLQWVADQVEAKYGINLIHVKLSDTSDAVSRVLAEKSAHNNAQGSIDLMWINGANFATMSEHSLLLKNWANKLPNFQLTDPTNNPSVTFDFGLPTQGMEAPWGQASLTFYYDNLAIDGSVNNQLPKTLQQLLQWSTQNSGRFSYPQPTDFLGMSFLKYALVSLTSNQTSLNQPVSAHNSDAILSSLWTFLDQLHPTLWRQGKHFMHNGAQMRRLVDDTELSLAFTFSGPEIPAAVTRFDLPTSIRSYAMDDGSLSNTHFVAVPYNASQPQAAQLVANFLLSPEAQAHKQKAHIWGDKTVLVVSKLGSKQQALFQTAKPHLSALPFNSIKRTLSEPHPSWVKAIKQGWQIRYGVSK